MIFCPKCGSLLTPRKEGEKKILVCDCGYTDKKKENMEIKEEVKQEEKELEVIPEDIDDEALPLVEAECPKCGHKKARYWLLQTRAGDEAETKFFKCEKCKNIWRDYS